MPNPPGKSLAGGSAGAQSLTNSISRASWTPAKLPHSPRLTSYFLRSSRCLRPVCCLSAWGLGAMRRGGMLSPSSPPGHPPLSCQSLLPMLGRPHSRRNRATPSSLREEACPNRSPASTYPRGSLEEILTLWPFLPVLVPDLWQGDEKPADLTEVLRISLKRVPPPQRELESSWLG